VARGRFSPKSYNREVGINITKFCVLDTDKGSIMAKGNNAQGKDKKKAKTAPKKGAKPAPKPPTTKKG
jgi:hypothetical protein